MTEQTQPDTTLTDDQAQRAEAVTIAARLLGRRISPMAGASLPEDRDTQDLTDLAQFILDGTHPLAAYREACLSPIVMAPLVGTAVDVPGLKVHWEGEDGTHFHGLAGEAFTTGDEDEVTCSRCLHLLGIVGERE